MVAPDCIGPDRDKGTVQGDSNKEYEATDPDTWGISFMPCSSESVRKSDLRENVRLEEIDQELNNFVCIIMSYEQEYTIALQLNIGTANSFRSVKTHPRVAVCFKLELTELTWMLSNCLQNSY